MKKKNVLISIALLFVIIFCGALFMACNGTGDKDDKDITYKITYDLNYEGGGSTQVEVDEYKDEVYYIKSAPETPVREGYLFAGWDTLENPQLSRGVSDTEWYFGSLVSDTAIWYYDGPNEIMEVTEDMTLYARWVSPVRISTAEQLDGIRDDLRGWYILENDIAYNGDWEPIGSYYEQYELYNSSWWKYAFKGFFDGNGKTITGLNMSECALYEGEDEDDYSAAHGSRNNTAAMFASVVDGLIKNLTLEDVIMDIEYDSNFAYIAPLAGFILGSKADDSVVENVHIINAQIDAVLGDNGGLYIGVAGLAAGHWSGIIKDCTTSGYINVETVHNEKRGGEVYIGGFTGEGYAYVENCSSTMDLTLRSEIGNSGSDNSAYNVYAGGIGASSTYTKNNSYSGDIDIYVKKMRDPANVYAGGIAGLQRYGYIENCFSEGNISIEQIVANGKVSAGGITGGFDSFMGVMGIAFGFDKCEVSNSLSISVVTATRASNSYIKPSVGSIIGSIPTENEIKENEMILGMIGVKIDDLKDESGKISYFGFVNCAYADSLGTGTPDAKGNTIFASIEEMKGDALKDILGNGWSYESGKLPVCNSL